MHEPRAKRKLRWPTIIGIVIFHLGAVAAIPYFSWTGLVVAAVLYFVCGCLGVCVGYHRLFTHRSFKTLRIVRWALALCGNLAGQGGVISWVAFHRKHHRYSDTDKDPHSPHHGGFLWAHMLWFIPWRNRQEEQEVFDTYAPDLLKEKMLRVIDALYPLWHAMLALFLFAAGWLLWDFHMGISLVLWGFFLRTVAMLHSTWAVNSLTHMWGYRNYDTTDDSRNNPVVAILAFGEGWHNNHHGHPNLANHGHHRWWELDPSYWVIWLLARCRLAWDVKYGRPTLQTVH